MYKVAGFIIKGNEPQFTRNAVPNFFFTKHEAIEFARQHRLPEDNITMIYTYEKLPYVESKDWVEP